MKITSLAIINASSPYSSINAKESLDLALIFGSYEQKVSLFFQGEGVWQLVNDQNPELLSIKNYLKTLAALEFYDIDNVYVCENSMKERNINENFHIENVSILSAEDFAKKLKSHHIVLRF